jgi:WD40 repeat protein
LPTLSILCRTAAAASFVLSLAACDGDAPLEPRAPRPEPSDALQGVSCTADVAAGSVRCAPFEGGAQGGPSFVRIIGGQGVNVRVASSNVAYDSVAQVFGMDVTVQNLLVQRMGTADGTQVSGVTLFFHDGPNVSGSVPGTVRVRNADGEGFFTGAAQPYFQWNEVLPLNTVSTARRWEFDVPRGVAKFDFRVYVRAELLPVVVFDRAVNGNRDIYRVALDGSDMVRVTTSTGDDTNATVGGNTIVFTSYRTGNAELFSMPLAGGTERRLTTTGAAEMDAALSIDGRRLAYTSNASIGTARVWTANADGTGAAPATTGWGLDGAPDVGPAWSPSGARLAFVSTGEGSPDIFEITLPGTPSLLQGVQNVTEVDPAFSPDGRYLVYVSNVTGGGDLYLRRLSDGFTTQLTTFSGADASPTWLPDGRIVYQAWLGGGVVELRWLDPQDPSRTGTIPLAAIGGRPDRPYAVPF